MSCYGTDFLLTLPRFTDVGAAAYRPGFERMHALMDGMGRPHEAFESVHVAGTNGKGSTASLLAAVAAAAGKTVGLHTSPHLVSVTERMRVNGAPAPDAWLDGVVNHYRPLLEDVRPSFFEATVALSFLYFAEQRVDLAVVEVGLGGRLDATNVIRPRLALITNVGLDHTDLLGSTHAEIAREKAGIIKPGVPVLTTAERPDVLDVIRTTAAETGAPFHDLRAEIRLHGAAPVLHGLTLDLETPLRRYEALRVGLPGRHQAWNAALALRAAELLLEAVAHDPEPVYHGMRDVQRLSGLRGRFEVVQERPAVVADVGHNAEGLAATLETLGAVRHAGRLYVLFGAMRDKDAGAMARLLRGAGATVFAARIDSERAFPPEELAELLEQAAVPVAGNGSVAEGLEWFRRTADPEDVLLVTGSHQLVAQLPELGGHGA